MHLGNPVDQAVQNEPFDDGLVSLQCVAGAGEVGVLGFVLIENAVDAVFNPPENRPLDHVHPDQRNATR